MIVLFDIVTGLASGAITIAVVLITSFVIAASRRVMTASDKVIGIEVNYNNLVNSFDKHVKNFAEHREDMSKTHSKIIDLFNEEIDPVAIEVKEHREKIANQGERLIRVETHLKIK